MLDAQDQRVASHVTDDQQGNWWPFVLKPDFPTSGGKLMKAKLKTTRTFRRLLPNVGSGNRTWFWGLPQLF